MWIQATTSNDKSVNVRLCVVLVSTFKTLAFTCCYASFSVRFWVQGKKHAAIVRMLKIKPADQIWTF